MTDGLRTVGVIGATSLVGELLLSRLAAGGYRVVAFSRNPPQCPAPSIEWRALSDLSQQAEEIEWWICAAPIWVLREHLALLHSYAARRIVALSSTSCFSKITSRDPQERQIAQLLQQGEADLREWAARHDLAWSVLRPTLIYGLGRDKNISEIARFISRFGFFPLCGRAEGLRQPVHAEDLASACVSTLRLPQGGAGYLTIAGGEVLTYREMVRRVFKALDRPVRFLQLPLWGFRVAIFLQNLLPWQRGWSSSMAERMNTDLVFSADDQARIADFRPRPFVLSRADLP